MQRVKSQPSHRRLDSLMSADELLGLSAYDMTTDFALTENSTEYSVEEASIVDLDLAFASPESTAQVLHSRRVCDQPVPGYDQRVDYWVDEQAKKSDASRTRARGLSNTILSFGKRARDSITGWYTRRSSSNASSGGRPPAEYAEDDRTRSYTSSLQLPPLERLGSLNSISLAAAYPPSAGEDLEEHLEAVEMYSVADRSPKAAKLLARALKRSVDQSCRNGEFNETLRFKLADGNNTTEAEQWAASAKHVQAVEARTAAVNDAFQRGSIYEAYAEDDDEAGASSIDSEALLQAI